MAAAISSHASDATFAVDSTHSPNQAGSLVVIMPDDTMSECPKINSIDNLSSQKFMAVQGRIGC